MNYTAGNGGLFNIIEYIADKGVNSKFKTCEIAKELNLNRAMISRILTIMVKLEYLEKHYNHPYVHYTVKNDKKLYILKFTQEVLKNDKIGDVQQN